MIPHLDEGLLAVRLDCDRTTPPLYVRAFHAIIALRGKEGRLMAVQAPVRPSPEERLQRRYEAAERYMQGDIDADEFEQVEQQYRPDYLSIMRTLVNQQMAHALFLGLAGAIGSCIQLVMKSLHGSSKS